MVKDNLSFSHGLNHMEKREYKKAVNAFENAADVDPQNPDIHYHLGLAWKELMFYERAESAYRKAIEIKPDFTDAWFKLGVSLRYQEKYEEAWTVFEKVVEMDPLYEKAWYNLGTISGIKENPDDMIKYYGKAAEINPSHHWAWSFIGDAYHNKKEYDDAESAYRKAIACNVADSITARALLNLGSILISKKMYEESEGYLLRALELATEKDDKTIEYCWFNLHLVYKEIGTQEQVESAIRKMTETSPGAEGLWICPVDSALDINELRGTLFKLTTEEGWHKAIRKVSRMIDEQSGLGWFGKNKTWLSIIDAYELIGFDGDIEEVFLKVKDSTKYEDCLNESYDTIVKSITDQLNSGGSTLLFDQGILATTKGAVICKDLTHARMVEFRNAMPGFEENLESAQQESTADGISLDVLNIQHTYYGFLTIKELAREKDMFFLYDFYEDRFKEEMKKVHDELTESEEAVTQLTKPRSGPSERLKKLTNACLLSMGGLTPRGNIEHEFSDERWEMYDFDESMTRGPQLKVLFESGYLEPIQFLDSIVWARKKVREENTKFDKVHVPSNLISVGDKNLVSWRLLGMHEIADTAYWALESLLEKQHPKAMEKLKEIFQVPQGYETGALIEWLKESGDKESLNTVVELAKDFGSHIHRSDVEKIIDFLEKRLSQVSDEDRINIGDEIMKNRYKEDFYESMGTSVASDLGEVIRSLLDSRNLALRIFPEDYVSDVLKNSLVGFDTHHVPGLTALGFFMDENVEQHLSKNGVDVASILIEYTVKETYNWGVKVELADHIIKNHKDSIEELRQAILNNDMWYYDSSSSGNCTREHIDRFTYFITNSQFHYMEMKCVEYFSKLVSILGEIGSFAILGEAISKSEEGDYYESIGRDELSKLVRDGAEYKTSEFALSLPINLAMSTIGGLSEKKRKTHVLKALRYPHFKTQLGACFYSLQKGFETLSIKKEIERIVRDSSGETST